MFTKDNTVNTRCAPARQPSDRTGRRLIALCLSIAASAAHAEPAELERFAIEIPDNWSAGSRDQNRLTLTRVSGDETPVVKLSTGGRSAGDQATRLARWHRSHQPSGSMQSSPVQSGRLQSGVASWLIISPTGSSHSSRYRISLLLEISAHSLLVTLDTTAEPTPDQLADLAQLLASARLAEPDSTDDSQWSEPQIRLSGFYATIGSGVSLSLLARREHVVGINGLILEESGRFALTETAMGRPLSTYCESEVLACGRYETSSERIATWRSTSPLEHKLGFMRGEHRSLVTEQDGVLVIGGAKFVQIKPGGQATLDGRFRSARTELIDGKDGEKLNAYRETLLTFHPDGEFQQSEMKALSRASTGTPISLSSAASPAGGTYQISDYELQLNYPNQEPVSLPLFMLQGVPVIDGSMYQRLKPLGPLATTNAEKKTANQARSKLDK